LLHQVKYHYCNDYYFVLLWHGFIELSHDLLHYSGYFYLVIVRLTGGLYWQTRFRKFLLWYLLLNGVLHDSPISLRFLWLLLLSILTQCSCVGLLWCGELREERPPRGSVGSSLFSSPFAWLQPRYDAGWGFSPSSRVQLQNLGVDSVFVFSGHSLCRWSSPYQRHLGSCMQLAQTWPTF
jgi:hypothetical protein